MLLTISSDCLNRSDYDVLLNEHIDPYSADVDSYEYGHSTDHEPQLQHPCLELKRILGGSTFYYSVDFDLTNQLQDRYDDHLTQLGIY